jgi:glycosyltransferase involved in cell wall biosynthesis
MTACDLVVQASKSEGCSRVICEAHAMGKPVAASDVGGNPEIVINGVTGFLFPPGSSVELAERIRNFIVDETLINQMGMSGRRRAVSDLSIQGYYLEIERVYRYLTMKESI